MRVAAHRLGG